MDKSECNVNNELYKFFGQKFCTYQRHIILFFFFYLDF